MGGVHRIMLREVVIDAPTDLFPAVRDFWAAALLTGSRLVEDHPEFTALTEPASLPHVGLQDVGADRPRFHLDLETDDVPAEVARLVGLGATEVSRGRSWVVLRDPAGLLLCVLPPESDEFAARSREVS